MPTVVFWLAVAIGLVFVSDPIVRGDFSLLATTAPIVGLVIWVFHTVLYHPHIRYDDERLVVTNIGRVHEVPWSRVVAVRQNITLSFELDDGRSIRAIGVTAPRDRGLMLSGLSRGKYGAGATHFHQHSDALRQFVGVATSGETRIMSRWDVVQLSIGAALTLAVGVDAFLILGNST